MKKYLFLGLKIFGGILAVLAVLVVALVFLLNTTSFQNKIKDYALESLSEQLQTKVSIDSVSVSLSNVYLYRLEIEDRQQRKMFQAHLLAVKLDLWGLLSQNLNISSARLDGVHARLYKPKDGEANYQFVLDAFKKDPSKKKPEDQPKEKSTKKKFTFDVNNIDISDIDVVFNEDTFSLGGLDYKKKWMGKETGHIRQLHGKLDMQTKKGPQTLRADIGLITLEGKREQPKVRIDSLHVAFDNHLPRKNEGKPNKGWFDPGHLDVLADMELNVDYYAKDTAHVEMTRFVARDSLTGFNVKDLRFLAGVNFKEAAYLSDITIQQENTILNIDNAKIVLPSKKDGRKFAFQTSKITGTTLLKDISRPFAPVLQKFTLPLELSVVFSGTDTTLTFRDIHVQTPDKKLTIDAVGGITNLNKSEELDIHFHVNKMATTGAMATQIIDQFTVKKLMIKQLNNLGNITYTGDVSILYHKEAFKGVLGTGAGNLDFDFYIDDDNKYINGHANTRKFHLGKVLAMKDINDVGVDATFKVDIDKERTLQMRRQYGGGKLPIGTVKAKVYEAGYKGVRVKNLFVDIKSNGAMLEGDISQENKGLDWACVFSFTDIDKPSNIKVRPKVKIQLGEIFSNPFKKKTPEEKEAKRKEKEQKKKEKERKKAEKKAAKEAKKKGK